MESLELSCRSGNIIEFPRSRAWKYQYKYVQRTTTIRKSNYYEMSLIGFDDSLEHQVNRLFDDFIRDLGATRRGETARQSNNDRQKWTPLVDAHERDKNYIVTAELPARHLFDGFQLFSYHFLQRFHNFNYIRC